MSEENRLKVMEEMIDFWIDFIYGVSTGSVVTANNNRTNLRHLKRILGIDKLEQRLNEFSSIGNGNINKIEALEKTSDGHEKRLKRNWKHYLRHKKEITGLETLCLQLERRVNLRLEKLEGEKTVESIDSGIIGIDSVEEGNPKGSIIATVEATTSNTNRELTDSKPSHMANIKQIIELYDNGHEYAFCPNTHIIVRKEDLNTMFSNLFFYINMDSDNKSREELRELDIVRFKELHEKYLSEDKG